MGKTSIAVLRDKLAHACTKEDEAYARMLRASNTFTKWFERRRHYEDRIETIETETAKIAERLLK